MADLPVAFRDLPAAAYPFTIRAFREDNGEKVWEETVDGPCALQVPALRRIHGVAVQIEIAFADGSVARA